jgi:predicted ferric reductase
MVKPEEMQALLLRSLFRRKETKTMLGLIAVVLIVLWLLGFFAFHVTTAMIHIILVVALILLVLHFVRGSSA